MRILDQKLDNMEGESTPKKISMFPALKFLSGKVKSLLGARLISEEDAILKSDLKKNNEHTEYPEDKGDPSDLDDLQGNYKDLINIFQDSKETKTPSENQESHPFDEYNKRILFVDLSTIIDVYVIFSDSEISRIDTVDIGKDQGIIDGITHSNLLPFRKT